MLCALHFQLRHESPITRVIHAENGRSRDTFWFLPEATSPDFGALTAKQCYQAYMGCGQLEAKNPEAYAVIEYMRAALANRVEILSAMKKHVDNSAIIATQIGNKTFFMPANPSPELEARMRRMVTDQT